MSRENIYWDSDPFLGWLQEEDGKVDLCTATLERAEKGEILIVTSALTLAEVLYQKRQEVITADKKDRVLLLFKNEFIAVRNVTRRIAEDARELVWSHSIAPKDAIHVATAIFDKVPFLETFDAGLLVKTGLIGSPPLVIRRPQVPPQGALPL
jgi:predicted nucleic acid-binding protein